MTDSRVERTGYSTIPKQCRFYMVGNLFTTVVLLFFDRGKKAAIIIATTEWVAIVNCFNCIIAHNERSYRFL